LKQVTGKEKFEYTPVTVDEELKNKVTEMAEAKLREYNNIADKDERKKKKHELTDEIKEALEEEFPESESSIGTVIHDLDAAIMREMIVKEGRRIDGRKPDEIRPITCEVGVLPRTHGSALFTRGQTQALVVCSYPGDQDR